MNLYRVYIVSDQLTVVFAFIILFVTVAAIYLLSRSFFKEKGRIKEEKNLAMQGVLTRSEINSVIVSYMARLTEEGKFSLIYIDLDKFTDYINAFGQRESEKILQKIVKNMEFPLPKGVKIARLQNDEFLIFLEMEFDRAEIIDLANKLKKAISTEINLFGDTKVKPTASIAVSFYPVHGYNLKDLLASLKIATYIIKKNGGNNVRVYSDEMEDESGQHVEYYYQIKHAIQHKEFQLFYQPILNVKTNEIFGVEALIRWKHPEHGLLSPFKFLGIMEQSGDILWIGLWGLETIIKTFQELKQEFPRTPIIFSLNISTKQLMSDTLATNFQRILKKYRMDAGSIVLEIIEFTLFEKQENIFKNLKKLKELGFKIAIDGFGLDYSTLSKADKLDIDIIKLDNDFLKEEESYMKAKFANLLVEFAKKNDYDIVCEAIESEEMMDEALKYDISIMQGYHFSKPISAESLRGYIGSETWERK